MNFEPIKYDYTLEEDIPSVTKTPTPPILSASALKRKKLNLKRRQSSASSSKIQSKQVSIDEKKKDVIILFDNENIDLDLSLEQTKELLKRQMRGGVDEKKSYFQKNFVLFNNHHSIEPIKVSSSNGKLKYSN